MTLTSRRDAPVLRLPFDLTSQMFCLCIPRRGYVRRRRDAPPLRLTQVCRQSRVVARATPELWRRIDFEFPVCDQQHDKKQSIQWNPAAMLNLWLTRSLSLSVSVSLDCFDLLPNSIIPILASHSHRWENLDLLLHPHDFRELAQAPGPFPRLQRIFENSPMLAVLDIRDSFVPDLLLLKSHLTALYLDYGGRMSGTSYWNDVFDAFPNLLHFGVYSDHAISDLAHPSSMQPLARDRIHFLNSLTIPTLRHLSVELYEALPTWSSSIFAHHVREFILQSTCELDILTLEVPECLENSDVSGELTLFRAGPTLSTLEFRLWWHGGFSDARYCLVQTPGILPNLKNLIITDLDSIWTLQTYNSFLDAVRAKRGLRSAALHSVPKNYNRLDVPPPPVSILNQLEELAAVDVRVCITAPGFEIPSGVRDGDPPDGLEYEPRTVFGTRPACFGWRH
ncbi:hypothetical protein C8R45DRAFT_1096741 [Mycena sanguinolenta]|nr:hypothetical protein C8R45DRAFT_1096741 [Mycena sanguinolenta]